MANNRIYYPIQQVAFRKPGTTIFREGHGVQSVAITTTFNLEQAFELGQLAIFENIEGIPDVEVTLSKVLDGYPVLFLLATATLADGTSPATPTLVSRAPAETIMQMGIWPETLDAVAGSPATYVEMSGLTVSSVTYNFPLEDNFSEDLTLAGNTKVWDTYGGTCTAPWTLTEATGSVSAANDDAPIGSGGVNRRENITFATSNAQADDADYTRLPGDIFGVTASGVKSGLCRVISITVSTDLAREDLFELGAKSPFAKTVTFPVEVTSDFEVSSVSGDQVSAIDDCLGGGLCASSDTLVNRPIRITTCEGLRINLGRKNKLASVNYGGGDAGGGNVTVSYSYVTFNDFTVIHSGDDFSESGQAFWNTRSGYMDALTQNAA